MPLATMPIPTNSHTGEAEGLVALQFDVIDVLPDGVIVTDVGAQIHYVHASIE